MSTVLKGSLSSQKQAPPEGKSGNSWADLTLSMGNSRCHIRPALSVWFYIIYSSLDPHWLQAVHLNSCKGFYAQS